MEQLHRRKFIIDSFLSLGSLSLATPFFSCSKNQATLNWSGFKYAMCNESMRDLSWEKQCEIIGAAGYKGVEIAAFTLVQQSVAELSAQQRNEMIKTMQSHGIECVGLHWLLAPPPEGLHFTIPDESIRKKTVSYLADLVNFCGDIGGSVMIFGSPKQRNTMNISINEAKKYFADGLSQVADLAQKRDVKILIEPLDTSQTDVINTLSEAIEIVKQINHPAIQTMFDFHNTPNETEPFDLLVNNYYDNIHHIHVQEMDGKHLGQGNAKVDFVKTFQLLKDKNYKGWISLEVFDFSPGGETIAKESMKILKEIESKLT